MSLKRFWGFSVGYRIGTVYIHRYVFGRWNTVRMDWSHEIFRILFAFQRNWFTHFLYHPNMNYVAYVDFNFDNEKSVPKRSEVYGMCRITVHGISILRLGRTWSVSHESKTQKVTVIDCIISNWNSFDLVSHFANCISVLVRVDKWRRYVRDIYNHFRAKRTSRMVRSNIFVYIYFIVHLYCFIIVYIHYHGRVRSC